MQFVEAFVRFWRLQLFLWTGFSVSGQKHRFDLWYTRIQTSKPTSSEPARFVSLGCRRSAAFWAARSTMAATRFLEVQLGGIAPDAFDAPAFYRSHLQGTRTVQVARVSSTRGGTKLLLSGDARECTKLWHQWQAKTKLIHQGSRVEVWAPSAPLHTAPKGKTQKKPTASLSRTAARSSLRPPRSMVEIIDSLGNDILPLQRAFDEECAVDERTPTLNARSRGARAANGVEDEAQVIPLQGALRALRRAGTEVSSRSAEDALKALGAEDRRLALGFDDFLRLHDLARKGADSTKRPFQRSVLMDGNRPRAETSREAVLGEGKIARGSLLAATLTASLNFEADDDDTSSGEADGAETKEAEVIKGTVREETIGRHLNNEGRAETMRTTQPKPKAQRLKDAFLRHDLYGDASAPGEISWSSLAPALAEAWGRPGPSSQACLRAAQAIDIAPHYPVDLPSFKKLSEALKGQFAHETQERQREFDGQLSTRVEASRAAFGTTKRAPTVSVEPGVATGEGAEPMMDPEIRSIRRLAMKQRYG